MPTAVIPGWVAWYLDLGKIPVAELRKQLKDSIPIRMYPDITQLYRTIPGAGLGCRLYDDVRKGVYQSKCREDENIYTMFAKYGAGSISYSEGTNDDVNKFVWRTRTGIRNICY